MECFNGLGIKGKPVISAFEGLNTGISPLLIGDGQAADMKNLDSRDYPLLKTRAHRELLTTVTGNVYHLGNILGEKLTVVADNVWKYWNTDTGAWVNIKTGMSGTGRGMSIEFVDYTIYVNGTTNYYRKHDGSTTGTFSEMPAVTALTVANQKLYGIEGNKLHHSDIRIPNEWSQGTDSGYIVVETPNGEELSAITTFAGQVIVWKPHSMHKLFGMYYIDHELHTVSSSIGCASQRSICEIGAVLYWLGDGHIYLYNSGSLPVDIGLPVKKYLDNAGDLSKACAGTDGERYYLCLPQKPSGSILLVYDTRVGVWHVEDLMQALEFTTVNNELYGMTSTGEIFNMVSDAPEPISWSWQSKWFSSGQPSMRQNWYRLYITLEKTPESSFDVMLVNNKGQEYAAVKSGMVYEDTGQTGSISAIKVLRVELLPSLSFNADWVQIQLSGTGDCKIHSIEIQTRTRKGSY